jgi:hypothetical protein
LVPAGETLKRLRSQGLIYVLALAIVLYTAGISCLVEVGDPRYRTPTDALIVLMLFVGWEMWRGLIQRDQAHVEEPIPTT